MENLTSLTHLNSLTDKRQIFFPLLYGAEEGSNEAAAGHALQIHHIVVYIQQDLIHSAQNGSTFLRAFEIGLNAELHVFPGLYHSFDSLKTDPDNMF